MGLQGVTGGYMGLQGLQEVTWGYKGLQEVTWGNTSAKKLKDKLKKFKTLWVRSLRVRYSGFSLRILVIGVRFNITG